MQQRTPCISSQSLLRAAQHSQGRLQRERSKAQGTGAHLDVHNDGPSNQRAHVNRQVEPAVAERAHQVTLLANSGSSMRGEIALQVPLPLAPAPRCRIPARSVLLAHYLPKCLVHAPVEEGLLLAAVLWVALIKLVRAKSTDVGLDAACSQANDCQRGKEHAKLQGVQGGGGGA